MADTTTGATAPTTTPAAARRITSTFRSRRNHGVFLLGQHIVGVYSSPGAVSVSAGHGPMMVTGSMKPDHARALAHALHAASNAAAAMDSEAMPAGSFYSALDPLTGKRVLLPHGSYFRKDGTLCGATEQAGGFHG